ncbi:MAG: hypothetical protein HKO86_02265 [Gammaproteobacteria bacterium]|nr:hypothetical protein [Gammaproteobacteria bacterium]NNL06521.1 hypothetical protein [Gammaproteobacteria bacterium]
MVDKNILFVPGKNPKPPAKQHREMLSRCLQEGIRRAEPGHRDELENLQKQIVLASWNHLYYNAETDGSRVLPWIDALLNSHGPSDEDIREAHAWHRRLNRLLYAIADQLPFIIRFLPGPAPATVNELRRYFENSDNIAYHIREQLRKIIRPMLDRNEQVLVIGHSMGSIIAYDTFWEMSHIEHRKDKLDFLSLGSPLGMNFVQHRLLGHRDSGMRKYPTIIRRWINVASVGDVTALDRYFHDDFRPMLELGLVDSIEDHTDGIYNFFHNEDGLNCHRSYGYLVNPAVGKIIADWWLASCIDQADKLGHDKSRTHEEAE